MKNLLFLPLLLLLFACGDAPDSERIVGKWFLNEVSEKGELIASADPAEMEELVETQLKKMERYSPELKMDREAEKKRAIKKMKEMGSNGYEFTKDFFFEFKGDGDTKRPKQYKLDEKKKTITIVRKGTKSGPEDTINYSFEGENLVLKMERYKFVLVRK